MTAARVRQLGALLAVAAYSVAVTKWLYGNQYVAADSGEPYYFRLLSIAVGLIVGRWWAAALPLLVIPLAIAEWDTGLLLAYRTLELVPTGVVAAGAGVLAHKLFAAVLRPRTGLEMSVTGLASGAARWGSLAAGVLVAGLVLVVHVVQAGWACDVENSACAASAHDETDYRGRLFTWEGRPLATRFQLLVQSQQDRSHPPVFATEADGSFCVTAPRETAPPFVIPTKITSSADVDPRFSGPDGYRLLESALLGNSGRSEPGWPIFMLGDPFQGPELEGGVVAPSTSVPGSASDSAFRCHQAGRLAEWYRYNDLDRSWQFFLLLALPVGSIALLGAAGSRRLSARARPATHAIGLLGAVLSALFFVILWDYKEEPDPGEGRPAWLGVPVAQLRTLPEFEPRAVERALRRTIRSEGYPPRYLADITCGSLTTCDITLVNPDFAGSRFTERVRFERTPVPVCWRQHSRRRVRAASRPGAAARGAFNPPLLAEPVCPASPA